MKPTVRVVNPCPVCGNTDYIKFAPLESDWCIRCADAELKRQVRFSEARVNPESP